ncbi:MAG: starch-binding protein [Ruminococcus sp.]|nr:starch-binding protein [Ruminococcus sp.]
MKLTRKMISVLLAVLMIASCVCVASVSATAASGDKVYLKNSAGWSNPSCYMWTGSGNPQNGAWPGQAMTNVSDDVWSYTLDADYENIIFNGNGGSVQTDDMPFPGGDKIYDNSTGQWSDFHEGPTEPDTNPPTVSSSKKDKSTFKTASITVTVTATNAETSYYQINGGAKVDFTGSTEVTLGADLKVGEYVVITVTAVNQYGTAREHYAYVKVDPSTGGGSGNDGSTSPAVEGNYGTNTAGFGKQKTITVDGDKSDWESSMLIAQGVANDDPRVFAPWAMHEIPVDNYALYAAWDNNNLYIMYEMANVQDIVAPGEDYPLTQGNQWINNIPAFLYIYTGNGNVTHGETAGGTLWDTGNTLDADVDHVVAYSTNASNGPFIYTADENGKMNPDVLVNKNTGISIKWGNGKTLAGTLMGINKAGGNNGRVAGDSVDASLVDFYGAGHKASMDMFYEISIPLKNLDISADDIENNGIGIMQISTYGTSAMDTLPFDPSTQDNAAKPYSKDSSTTMEKEDEDHITVPLARIGKALSGGGGGGTPTPMPEIIYPNVDDPAPITQPQTDPVTDPVTQPQPQTQPQTDPVITTDPQPIYTQPQPVVTDPQPIYTQPQPVVTDPQPIYTQPQPVVTDPVPATQPATAAPSKPAVVKPKTITTNFMMDAGEDIDVSVSGSTKFTSSKSKVAKVSSKGKVVALTKGTTVVTVTTKYYIYKYNITVASNPKLSKKSVTVKKGKTAKVRVSGKASGVNLKFKNTKIAKITSKKTSSKLKIKGLKKGSTTLYVTVNGKKLKLKVKVTK